MSSAARPIPATLSVDRFTSASDVLEFGLFDHLLAGTQPYVRTVAIAEPCAPASLLPEGASVERCVTTDTSVFVLARTAEATIHVAAYPRSVTVHISATTHALAERVADDVRDRVPPKAGETVKVRLWHHTCNGRSVSQDRALQAPQWADIQANYPEVVRHELDSLMRLARPASSGKLLLWHGPPGTGKTTALRSLIRAWEPWCQAQYIADPERFFAEPGYISEVLTTAPVTAVAPSLTRAGEPEAIWRLVIAEDSDEYLRATARRDAGAALGRLLNLADGILGQGTNVLILLTTNEEISRLHPALVRPGRCMASVEFEAFQEHEALAWLGEAPPSGGSQTLAELLALRGDLGMISSKVVALVSTGHYL